MPQDTRQDTAARALRTHVVVGQPDHVRSALARAFGDGRLAGVRDLVELPGRRVQVTAELWEPADRPRGPRTGSGWRWLRPALTCLLVALLAGGLAWLLMLAVSALVGAVTAAVMAGIAWVTAQLPLIVAAGIGLLALAVPVGSRCAGLHCGGCPR